MTTTIQQYREFIASRAVVQSHSGFSPKSLSSDLKTHQKAALEFALNRGKSAAFLDTGLGKSFIELELAKQAGDNLRMAEQSVGDLFSGVAA